MKKLLLILCTLLLLVGCRTPHPVNAKIAGSPATFCNPVNLNYRFMKIEESEGIREAADPVVISFKRKFYLFASKLSGYCHSNDFRDWKHAFMTNSVLPIEDYAPGLLYKMTTFFTLVLRTEKEYKIARLLPKKENEVLRETQLT